MKNKCIYILCFFAVFFLQCRTTQLEKIENMVRKTTPIKFLNSQEFNVCRELMLKTFSANVIENDSIIILEYFADGVQGYYCTIYESKDRILKGYYAARTIKNGDIHVDSLKMSNVRDKILPMVINSQLNEVKKRGDNTTLTPAATLIINILIKNEDKTNFNIETILTQNFNSDD